MDHVVRLMRRVLPLVLFCVAIDAHAAGATAVHHWFVGSNQTPFDSAQEACAWQIDHLGMTSPSVQLFSDTEGSCRGLDEGSNTPRGVASLSANTTYVCPDPSVPPNMSAPVDQQCPTDCPTAGTSAGDINIITGWATGPALGSPIINTFNPSASWCSGGCRVHLSDVTDCTHGQVPHNGYYASRCDFNTAYSGESCSGSSDPPTDAPPPTDPPPDLNRCPTGTHNVGTDEHGTSICKGDPPPTDPPTKTTTTSPPTTTTTTNGDGSTSTTTTTTTITNNSDGSHTTITNTTITNNATGTSTTSTQQSTGNTPNGTPGKPDKPDSDLCKQNPTLNICQNSQVSGSCGDVSCTGDAIQCAIYRQQKQEYCDLKADSNAKTLGNKILSGADDAVLPTAANSSTIELGQLDQSSFMSSQCINDVTLGSGVTLHISAICDYILPLRYIIMTVAGLVCFGMLRQTVMGI